MFYSHFPIWLRGKYVWMHHVYPPWTSFLSCHLMINASDQCQTSDRYVHAHCRHYIYMCLAYLVHASLAVCEHMGVWVCNVYRYIYVYTQFMSIWVVCGYIGVHACVYVRICMCICMSVGIRGYVRVSKYVCIYICVYIYMCACMCMCQCIYVGVSIWSTLMQGLMGGRVNSMSMTVELHVNSPRPRWCWVGGRMTRCSQLAARLVS